MLSLLLFSRNDTKNALSLAESMLNAVDEVVIIDSSDEKEHNELVEKARKYRKINVFYALPLGYVEPLRSYGISKCKADWIFYLDTDERPNEKLLSDLNKIVNSDCDAFAIKRYEEATASSHTQFFTWQFRLFKKSAALFKGIIHEQPIINGKLCTLGDNYFIAHRIDLMHHERNDYNKMLLFEMLSYRQYNEVFLDYIRKFFAIDQKSISGKIILGFFNALLHAYETLFFKKQDSEISRRDYLWFYFIRTLAYGFRHGRIGSIFEIWNGQKKYFEYLEKEREKLAEKYGLKRVDLFNISQIIYKEGVIKYLGFDKPENVEKLTNEYLQGKLKEKGTDLTIRLIVEKYKKRR
ncbi:MAG: glycosyltransferase [Candidatus Micrarchaeales archaeon]